MWVPSLDCFLNIIFRKCLVTLITLVSLSHYMHSFFFLKEERFYLPYIYQFYQCLVSAVEQDSMTPLSLAYLIPLNKYHLDNTAKLNQVTSIWLGGWNGAVFFEHWTPYTHSRAFCFQTDSHLCYVNPWVDGALPVGCLSSCLSEEIALLFNEACLYNNHRGFVSSEKCTFISFWDIYCSYPLYTWVRAVSRWQTTACMLCYLEISCTIQIRTLFLDSALLRFSGHGSLKLDSLPICSRCGLWST